MEEALCTILTMTNTMENGTKGLEKEQDPIIWKMDQGMREIGEMIKRMVKVVLYIIMEINTKVFNN